MDKIREKGLAADQTRCTVSGACALRQMHCQRRMRTPTHAVSAAHAHSNKRSVRHVCKLNAPTGQLSIAHRIKPIKWSEKTGLDLQGFPVQSYGNDCGVFMLMSALYIVLDAPFDYTIQDMVELRKWWCVMLMENFGLDRHGKLFAHYTEESKAFLRGDQQPVYRLQKRKVEEISQEEPFDGQVDETILFNSEFASEKQVVQSPRKERVMTDLETASQWCLENSGDLLGSVQLPLIMCMEYDEAAEALEQFFSTDVIEHDSVEPMMFVFTFMQDMHKFLENVVDKMHLRVFCRVQN